MIGRAMRRSRDEAAGRPTRVWMRSLQVMIGACVAGTAHADTTLIPTGAVWKYLDDGTDQGSAWRAPSYVDGDWASGPAQLGYGDGDEATTVGFGPNENDKYITTYFRHTFDVADPTAFFGLTVRLLRDDGAIVYLNDTEIFRSNMPGGAVDYLTLSSAAISGPGEDIIHETVADQGLLVPGDNVVAIELHQRGPTSSDISLDFELIADDGMPSVARGPYLQRGTDSGVVVCWRTSIATDSRVRVGASPGSLTTIIDDASVESDHTIVVNGLLPDTTYYYSVGTTAGVLAGDDTEHFFVTAPEIGSCRPMRIWAIGDSGTANANAAAVRSAYQAYTGPTRTDVWLMLGDNAYTDGTDAQYQAAVFEMYPELLRQTVVWPTLGNHDAISADSASESGTYYDIFTLPRAAEAGGMMSGTEAYYSFDWANVHFVCLDSQETDHGLVPPLEGGAMLTWLAADLADTTADWVIAYWHHPPYTKGSHDSDDPGDSGGRLRDMREVVLPILETGGVDLVLTGHSHSYERSFLIDGAHGYGDTTPPFATLQADGHIVDGGSGEDGGDGRYEKGSSGPAANQGTVYVVNGASGRIGGGDLNHPVMYTSINELGSMVIDIDGADRLDAIYLNSTGAVRDTFTIVKGVAETPGDVDRDTLVDLTDLLAVLTAWGPCPGCPEDVDDSCVVDVSDLLTVLANWG